MNNLKTSKRRTLAAMVLMALLTCVFISMIPLEAHAATAYNASAAVNYAVAHWNESGLCDAYVKACLAAGGINISSSGVVNVYNELLNYGTSYQVVFAANDWLADCYARDNVGHLDVGDIIFYYCSACGGWTHTSIVTRVDDSGKVHYCAHNAAAGDAYFNQSYGCANGHHYPNITHYVIHITGNSSSHGIAQLSVAAGNSLTPSTFTWTSVSGATGYHLRIFKDTVYTGEDYTQWNVSSGCKVTLPAGTYYAYVDTSFSTDSWTQSNIVEFVVRQAYNVTYDANGGTGAPSNQIKISGIALTLSSTQPTRSGYTFQGWATSANGSVAYAPGASYTANSGLTLYAVWAETQAYQPTDEWEEMSSLPYIYDPNICEIQYNNHYVYNGRTSPGAEWTLSAEGAVQYENDGEQYNSDNPLETSATRVLVGHYYFHWCDNGASYNANYYQKSYLPYYHTVPMSDIGTVITATEAGTDGDGSGRKVYKLTWLSGEWAGGTVSCCSNGTQVYYQGNVYQNKKAYRINTYVKESGWTDEVDPSADSVTYRLRRKQVTSIDFEEAAVWMDRGDTLIPPMILQPETAERSSLTWVSDNPAIASVDENGAITAVSLGETYITASSDDGNVFDTLHVTVETNVAASSLFVVDDTSVGFFGIGLYDGKMSEYSNGGLVCMVREPGDVLNVTAELCFTNDLDECIIEYEVTEGNLVRAGNDAFVVSKNTDRKNVITAHVYEVDEEGAKGTEMVWANVVVFIVKDDNVLKLPVGLNRIEANAFEGIAADIICLPDYVTLEDDSLAGIPAGTIIYFNSDTITPFYDNFVLGTEVYRNPDYYWIDTGTPTLEYFNGNGCCTNYFCLDTSDN